MTREMTSDAPGPGESPFGVALEDGEGWVRRLTITVPPERVERSRVAERARLSRSLRLKGFRKGKVPAAVVEQRFGDLLRERTLNALIQEGFREAVRSRDLHPIGDPKVGQVRYEPGEDLVFQVQVEVMPELELSRVKGFRVKRERMDGSGVDREIDRVLERMALEHADWEPTSESPADGDAVSVRITPQKRESGGDEVAPEPSPRSYRFALGEGRAVPDVEQAIRSLRPGESGEFRVRMTGGEEAGGTDGEPQTLRIELESVEQRVPPPIDDAFASRVSDSSTLRDLRNRIGEDLRAHQEEEAESRLREAIIDEIIEANPFEAPETLVNEWIGGMLRAPEGSDPAQLEGLRESLRPHAIRQVKRHLILEHLIEREGLRLGPEELEGRIREIAQERGESEADVRRGLEKEGGMEALGRHLAVERLFDYLKSVSVIE